MLIKGMFIGAVITIMLGCALTEGAARSIWQQILTHDVRIIVQIEAMPHTSADPDRQHFSLSFDVHDLNTNATLPIGADAH
jgi:hypothetical protein